MSRLRHILLIGSSHLGKTTIAAALAEARGCTALSTDKLGRHPGRPWEGAPEPVLSFFGALDAATIHWFLTVHHANLRPVIAARLAEARPMVLEGAALRPEFLNGWGIAPTQALCLTAAPEVLSARMRAAAEATMPSDAVVAATEAFITRSLTESQALTQAAHRAGVPVWDVSDRTLDDLTAAVIAHFA